MPLSHAILLAGYASILLELCWLSVPSVASTWALGRGRRDHRWLLVHAVPAAVAVAGFVLPGVLCVVEPARRALVMAALDGRLLAGIGGALVVLGRAWTLAAVAALRTPATTFVTHGPYARCRNPALCGLHVFLLGGVLIVPGAATAAGLLGFVAHMHRRVMVEEAHLRQHGGAAYAGYLARVRRYVPGPLGQRPSRRRRR